MLEFAKKMDHSFVSTGFKNWKKAIEKCNNHENCETNKLALANNLEMRRNMTVVQQIEAQITVEQLAARNALLKIVSTLRHLAARGAPFQGHGSDEGNFIETLHMRAEDCPEFAKWLKRKHNYTSNKIQNEILRMMSHKCLRKIIDEVKSESETFGIVVDGTQDIQRKEQESICIRYVDNNLEVHERCLGLYNIDSTTGKSISSMIQDVLIRFNLPILNLRAQTYDGAANMSGKYNGCQAEIKKIQPLALFTTCGAHATHLVVQKSMEEAPFMRDAIDKVQDVAGFFQQSGKFKLIYEEQYSEDNNAIKPGPIRPICPTRWLTRESAVRSVLTNYSGLLNSLKETKETLGFGSNVATRANNSYINLANSKCVLGLVASKPILHLLEMLNQKLMATSMNVDGMLKSVDHIKQELYRLRDQETFAKLFDEAAQLSESLSLPPVSLPRIRKIHKKYDIGVGLAHTKNSEESFFNQVQLEI